MSPNRVKNSVVNDVNSGVVGIGFLKANVLVSEYLVRVGRVPATFVDIFRLRKSCLILDSVTFVWIAGEDAGGWGGSEGKKLEIYFPYIIFK